MFMYALGVVCTLAVVRTGKPGQLYEHWASELAVDVAAVAIVLWLISRLGSRKKGVRVSFGANLALWLKRLFYLAAYVVALVDVFCFVKFDSTLTPTMLLLVGETNSGEAGEFLRNFVGWDVLTSRVGWVLALMVLHAVWASVWRKMMKWPIFTVPIALVGCAASGSHPCFLSERLLAEQGGFCATDEL